jgi:katanin p60 ATPase-containing subunit A1
MMQMRRAMQSLEISQIANIASKLEEHMKMPIQMSDFNEAIGKVSSSVSKEMLEKYDKWMKDFGSV